jgi:hypothetical protein
MKKLSTLFLSITILALCFSCDKLTKQDDPAVLSGDQSPMGEVGVTISSSTVENAGVSNFSATVTSVKDGISTYTAQAKVTNPILKNMIANFPGVTIDGDNVSLTDMKIKQTTEGIQCLTGPGAGILVKYNSSVGDTYPIGSTGQVRTVVSKTSVDDYPYGFYLIKTIQVESNPNNLKSTAGISKITYVANHRFGLVGVKLNMDDGSDVTFPVYSSAENN